MAKNSHAHLVLDTSCIVALLCTWHERHDVTLRAVETRLDRGERLVVAAHALVESYAVLTRLPAPQRLAPEDARHLLMASFRSTARVVTLDAKQHWELIAAAPEAGVRGGRTYDALIAASAAAVGHATLLTLNRPDFESFESAQLSVVDPSDGA